MERGLEIKQTEKSRRGGRGAGNGREGDVKLGIWGKNSKLGRWVRNER